MASKTNSKQTSNLAKGLETSNSSSKKNTIQFEEATQKFVETLKLTLPIVKVAGTSPLPSINSATIILVETNEKVFTLIYKKYPLKQLVLHGLLHNINKLQHLRDLKLEFCGLHHEHINALIMGLQRLPDITLLSLDGNPEANDDFAHLLEENTYLRHFSAKHCQITCIALKNISDNLASYTHPLLSLNLACNSICNKALSYLKIAMESNRRLLYLNLKDNIFDEDGIINFLNTFKAFPLSQRSIEQRRTRRFEILRTKQLLEDHVAQEQDAIKNLKTEQDKSEIVIKATENSSIMSALTENTKRTSFYDIDEELNNILFENEHPFVKDCYAADKQIYCYGNFVLSYLNLSFNNITKEVLEKILEVLHYQYSMKLHKNGLSQIVLQGNDVERYSNLLQKINDYFNESDKFIDKPSKRRMSYLEKKLLIKDSMNVLE